MSEEMCIRDRLTAEYRAKKYRADTDQVFFLVAWCLVGGLLGAKILFWITEWKEVVADPGFILRTMTDGFVVYGGIIGGIIAGWLYSRITKLNFLEYFDLLIPSVALALSLIHILYFKNRIQTAVKPINIGLTAVFYFLNCQRWDFISSTVLFKYSRPGVTARSVPGA